MRNDTQNNMRTTIRKKDATTITAVVNPIINSGSVKRILDPSDRFSELLFGIVMTLSITGTISIVAEGDAEIKVLLLSVLGCNIAWGLIDAALYLIAAASIYSKERTMQYFVQHTKNERKARKVIEEALPDVIADAMLPKDIALIHKRIARLPETTSRGFLPRRSVLEATGVFLVVLLSCVPLLTPFLFIDDVAIALRVSNVVAIIMLFIGGYNIAKYSGLPKILTGTAMVVLGALMVFITILLGG